jgi:DNA-binding transcriptional LysR family regulator
MHVSQQLYALVMDLELRHLRCLVAIVDSGSFTDAAIDLGISQAAVSRNLKALEQALGVRLLHRTSRNVAPTTAGVNALAQARQVLAAADNLVAEATTGHTRLRIGHAWAAMGRHTREFQRRWADRYPDVELHLIRTNSPTAGLAEGLCDIAVVRTEVDTRRFASAIVGRERRYCALAADDPWARRRSIGLNEIPERTLLVDPRTGSTTPDLWPPDARPPTRETHDVDDWLAIIAAGGSSVGITPEGTTTQYRRDGVVFRPLRDAPPIAVQMIWRRPDPHPSTHAAIALLAELYGLL